MVGEGGAVYHGAYRFTPEKILFHSSRNAEGFRPLYVVKSGRGRSEDIKTPSGRRGSTSLAAYWADWRKTRPIGGTFLG